MTDRIYYTDAYCSAFQAWVSRSFLHDGRPAVVLDRTAFYPTSGGQPHDLGTLSAVAVQDVVDLDDGTVMHVVASPLAEGTSVEGAIDWTRRFDHMQQHTGQHVLSAAFDRLFKNRTMSFHLGADASTIDLAAEVSPEALAAAEEEANRIVWEDRPVTVRFMAAEEASTLSLRKEPSRTGTLRLVHVEDYDLSACGGTHVARTGAIGVVALTAWERFRGGTRVTFVCGGRTLRVFRTYRDAVAGSIRALSVLPVELPAAVARAQADAKDLRRSMKTLQERLARYEADRLTAAAPVIGDVRVIVAAIEGWDAAGLKAIASAATGASPAVAALVAPTRPAQVVTAASMGLAVEAQGLLQQLVERFGGRGGGRRDLAQAGGLEGDVDEILSEARRAIEQRLSR